MTISESILFQHHCIRVNFCLLYDILICTIRLLNLGRFIMKRIDFENGTVTNNILSTALPMLVAQILNLLYNIVDRIYIARIQDVGTTALGAVGLCFPIIMVITAFSNLFGSGGAPIFSINRGKGDSRFFPFPHW